MKLFSSHRWASKRLLGVLSSILVFLGPAEVIAETPTVITQPSLDWEYVYPKPTAQWLRSVASGTPGFVAVGNGNGEIIFSEDGLQWLRVTDDATAGVWFSSVCYGSDRYLAVGGNGAVFWSFDGRHWSRSETGVTANLGTCTAGNGLYVVGGGNQTLLVSTNCVEWEQRPVPKNIAGIVHGSTNWVAVTIGSILASPDLANWTVVSPNSQFPVLGPMVQSVTYGNGRFIATGAWGPDQLHAFSGSVILYSDDAVHWEFAPLSGLDAFGEIPASTFANGQFVAVQQHAILRSSDGVLWERFPDIPAQYALRGVAGAETGQFVTVGDSGEIMTSDDARTWITRSESPKEIHSVVFAEGRFVAVGGSPYYIGGPVGSAAVLTSTNGYQWQSSLTNLTSQLSSVAYGRVAHGRKRWVVTGDDGQVFVSTDAIHWSDHTIPGTSLDLSRVVFGSGNFIAFVAGRDLAYRSSDGVHWRLVAAPGASEAQNARFLHGLFVAGGPNGQVLFSATGSRWNRRATPATQNLECVAYGNGLYVAGGESVIVSSRNGIKWQATAVPIAVHNIQFVSGWFVAIGRSTEVLISRDGLVWEPLECHGSTDGYALSMVASGNDVLVGSSGLSLYRGILKLPGIPRM